MVKLYLQYYEPVIDSVDWGVKKNEKLSNLYGEEDLVTQVKKNNSMPESVIRMDNGPVTSKIFVNKPNGRRNIGRTILRWLEDLEKNIRAKNDKMRRQRETEVNLLKEFRVHLRPQLLK